MNAFTAKSTSQLALELQKQKLKENGGKASAKKNPHVISGLSAAKPKAKRPVKGSA